MVLSLAAYHLKLYRATMSKALISFHGFASGGNECDCFLAGLVQLGSGSSLSLIINVYFFFHVNEDLNEKLMHPVMASKCPGASL